jgi:hypothetical protein
MEGGFPGQYGRSGREVLAKNRPVKGIDLSFFRVANRASFASVKTITFLSKSDEVIVGLRNPSTRS